MDVFISYAHVDNKPLQEGQKGWVEEFHKALEVRVLQWLGRTDGELKVWRDRKLAGNDAFAEEIARQLEAVRVLVSVLSPRYVNSEWCTREVREFCQAAERGGGIVFDNKSRLFKVVKMPVPRERVPEPLQPLLGYEFFREEDGRPRELHEMFGADAKIQFWLKLDDLAYDVANLLQLMAVAPDDGAPGQDRPVVYLASCTGDLGEEQAGMRAELEGSGYPVVPGRPPPLTSAELEAQVRRELERASLAVILVGRVYGLVPEGGTLSLAEVEDALASERSRTGAISRLIWTPPGLEPSDERQRGFLARLRSGGGFDEHTDLLEGRLEDHKTVIRERLQAVARTARPAAAALGPEVPTTVYVVCDQLDLEAVGPVAEALFQAGLDPVQPVFAGTEAELREEHEERLRSCGAVLLYYGAGTDLWLGRKLRELERIRGLGRTRPMLAQAILVAPPETLAKQVFRTRSALVLRQSGAFDAQCIAPFIELLRRKP